MMNNRNAVVVLNEWKEAVGVATDDAGRDRQRLLAQEFAALRQSVVVTSYDGEAEFVVVSLSERSGRIYVVPGFGVETILRDDANNPRVAA